LPAFWSARTPAHIEKLWQKMMVAQMAHGVTGVVGAGAMSGIDMALWDIKGKALGTPVWNLLGGQVRDRIRIYSHASAPDVALELKQRGITAVKTGWRARSAAQGCCHPGGGRRRRRHHGRSARPALG
jgi:L-alanine-DL-glutamate epimerase-like enolase superfamily enzyme